LPQNDQAGWIPECLLQARSGHALLHALFHQHPDMLFVVDSHGRIVAANSIALKNLGYRKHQLQGHPIHMLVPAALRKQHAARTESFFNHPACRPMGSGIDLSICDAGGNEYPADMTLSPFHAGTELYVLVACRRLDADMAHKQRQIHALVENARGYAVVLLDTDGKIRTWNDGAEQIYGLSASAALGQDHSILFTKSERDAGEPTRQLEQTRLSSQPVLAQAWRVNFAAAEIWAEIRCEASRDASGQVTGFTRTLHDATAHKLLENELRETNRALTALAADLEKRVSERTCQLEETVLELRCKKIEMEAYAETVAHDLREKEVLLREVYHRVKNNLQVVQSLLKTRMRTLASPDAQEALEAAMQRIQVMATVHEHLYQMPDLAGLSLSAYLKDVVDGAVQSSITRSDPPEVRFSSDDIPINLDSAIPMGLLVHELVSNCFKHGLDPASPNQHGLIKVSVTRGPESVRLTVQDNGPGLPANFDPEESSSMGLKLAISLAKRLGGQLRFTSQNGCTVQADLTRL
jgi:PAS domain S-box-containing protein